MNTNKRYVSRNKTQLILLFFTILILFKAYDSNAQVGFSAGTEYGFGFVAHVGTEAATLELGGGLAPLLSFTDATFGDDIFKIYFPGTVGAKLSIRTKGSEEENRLGIKFGLSYNTLLKTGFGGGIDYKISKKPKVIVGSGAMIFPAAKDELRKQLNEDKGTNYTDDDFSAPTAFLQPFISISILFWSK